MIFPCSDLVVPQNIMQHVVRVESSGNPYAIGVVGGRLQRQPRNLKEAVATAKMLEQKGYNFSLGIAQINRYNMKKYGLHSYEHAFQICPNLKAGSFILKECFDRSKNWGNAFSCYYSGNFVTGYKHGYVQKIFASMKQMTYQTSPYSIVKKMPSKATQPYTENTSSGLSITKDYKKLYISSSSVKSIEKGQEISFQKGIDDHTENYRIDNAFVF
ncbi:MAG: lytic transglycosylase domain-containing protein [Treponema sp.]